LNSFFNVNDKRVEELDNFKLPSAWWSRPYEYNFAKEFLNEDDIIIDAGCGIEHPFKDHASKRVKKIYAIDKDEQIKSISRQDNMEVLHIDLLELNKNFENESIDKIFCISVLHQNVDNAAEILRQFKQILKPNGLIIITFDYPFFLLKEFEEIVYNSGLEFVGQKDFEMKENILTGYYSNLNCFKAVLRKKECVFLVDLNYDTKVENVKENKKQKRKGTK
jgi:SAM-dependent methyltransferase